MTPEHATTTITAAPEPVPHPEPELQTVERALPGTHLSEAPDPADEEEGAGVDLGRMAWLATVLACTIAVVVLMLQGYYGYAGVTFAVAASAAINLF